MNRFLTLALILGATSACQTTSSGGPAPLAQPTAEAAPAAEPGSPLEMGRELTSQFYAGEMGPVWSRMNQEMRNGLGSEANLAAFRKQVEGQLGSETEVQDEKVIASPPYQVYLRTVSFSKFDKPIEVQWALDAEGNIAGFFIKPKQ